MQPDTYFFFPRLALFWVPGLLCLFIAYRLLRKKPIFFFSVREARFIEGMASGYSNDRWWRRFGGVRNCLVVAVTGDRLVVRPWFPFTLMFLPELSGLELDVALSDVLTVTVSKGVFKRFIRVRFRDQTSRGDITLMLRYADDFLARLPKGVVVSPASGS